MFTYHTDNSDIHKLQSWRTVEYLSFSIANNALALPSPSRKKRRVSFPSLTQIPIIPTSTQPGRSHYSQAFPRSFLVPSLFPKNRKSTQAMQSMYTALKQSTTPQPPPSPPAQPSCSKPCTSGRRIQPTAGGPRLRRHLHITCQHIALLHLRERGVGDGD
jgi:hypothetical protein